MLFVGGKMSASPLLATGEFSVEKVPSELLSSSTKLIESSCMIMCKKPN